MKKVLKFLLIVFIWALVLGICFAGAVLLGYPESIGIQLFIAIFAIWYSIKFIFFLYNRWQAKQRVEKLINVQSYQSKKKRLSYFQFLFTKDVDRHIAKVIKRVTATGDASLNDLNWVMHLKLNNQDGDWLKQDTVNKPKLSDPVFTEYKHLEWIVYNEFMLLDVDSYLMNEGNPSAKEEWLQLLNGLSYSNKQKSLDSMLVTIDVNELKDTASRNKTADIIRAKFEDIREYCGVELTISIVLTGIEQLKGADIWLADIAQEWRTQTLGAVNTNNTSPSQLFSTCFGQLQSALEQGSLKHLVNHGFSSTMANLSKDGQKLHSSLVQFSERFFKPSQYQSAPSCSGLYIVMKEKSEFVFADSLLESNALCWSPAISTNKSTVSDVQKRKKLIAYASCGAVLAFMISLVHSNDKESIEGIFNFYKQQVSGSEAQAKLVENFQARYELVNSLSEVGLSHWGLDTQEVFAIDMLKMRLAKDIQDLLIEPIDINFEQKIERISNDDFDAKVDYLNVLMRRINILKAARQGTSIIDLVDFPQPFDTAYIENMPSLMLDNINDIYLKNLVMSRSRDREVFNKLIDKKIDQYRDKVSSLLLSSDGSMEWLTSWVNSNSGVTGVKHSDYWKGTNSISIDSNVDGVYTIAGKEALDNFIAQLSSAMGDTHPFLVEHMPNFMELYQTRYVASWGAFLNNFNQGVDSLKGRSEWLNVISNVPNSRNIFFKVLNDVDDQLTPFKTMAEKPDWFELVLYYQDMLALGNDKNQGNPKKNKVLTKLGLKMVSALGPVGKAISKQAKSGLKTKKKLDKAEGAGPGPTERELNLQEAATTLDDYKVALAAIVFNIEQRKQSYANIKGYFEFDGDPTAAATSLSNTQLSIKKLQSLAGKAGTSTAPFWNVYAGAVSLMEQFMIQEAACHVDKAWQDDYLFELEGVPDYKLDTFAYGETGILWDFVNSQLTPFLQKKRTGGFSLKRVDGNNMPFSGDLLSYLIRAKDVSNQQKYETYTLKLQALPTDLNEDALLYVSETTVALHCAEGDQTLLNNNFIVKSQFNWQPSCTAASVKIKIGNKTIERFYGGQNGVYDFLSDFKAGKKRFELEQFPEYFYVLNQYKIRYFDVNLDIDGGLKLMNSLHNKPPSAPEHITACWN